MTHLRTIILLYLVYINAPISTKLSVSKVHSHQQTIYEVNNHGKNGPNTVKINITYVLLSFNVSLYDFALNILVAAGLVSYLLPTT